MENLRGIALMTLAMASFALADALIKLLSGTHPTGQVLMIISVFGAVGFGVAARMQGNRILTADFWQRAVIARNFGEALGTSGFITALALTPLSTASAVIQSAPLLVTLGAAVFLQEKVGLRRWLAILVGFVGVMIIIRPGVAGFDANALFAVQGAIGLAIRDLASRAVPRRISTFQLGCWGFLVTIPIGAIMWWIADTAAGPIDLLAVLILTAIIVGVAIAIYAITAAMRIGDVAVVSPFRYTRLVFGLFMAMVMFGERPDATTWVGAAIVVASGLYTFWRERRVGAVA